MKITIGSKDKIKDLKSGDILKIRYKEYSDDIFYIMFLQNKRDNMCSYFLYLDDMSLTELDEFISFDNKDTHTRYFSCELVSFSCISRKIIH